jgi:hypothetical protein
VIVCEQVGIPERSALRDISCSELTNCHYNNSFNCLLQCSYVMMLIGNWELVQCMLYGTVPYRVGGRCRMDSSLSTAYATNTETKSSTATTFKGHYYILHYYTALNRPLSTV